MKTAVEKPTRPSSITLICVLGFIGAIFTVPLIFSPIVQQLGSWYPSYLAFSAVVGLICMVGLWLMKKWAVHTYLALVIINQVVLLVMGRWNLLSLLIPAIVADVGYRHLSKMS